MENELVDTQLAVTVDYIPTKITIRNQGKLEKAVDDYVAKYDHLVISPETLAVAKNTRAGMRKVSAALDDKRKEIKRGYNKPLAEFEAQIKSLQAKINNVIGPIDEGVKELEEYERNQRLLEVQQLIDEIAPNYEVEPEKIDIKPEWLNKSLSNSKRLVEITDAMKLIKLNQEKLTSDILAIENYAKAVNVEPAGWVSQIKNGIEVADVMNLINRSIEDKKQREQAAAEARKAIEEAKAAELATHTEIVDGKKIDTETGEVIIDKPKIMTCVLKVEGTFEQLSELNGYMRANSIQFSRIQ